MATASVKQSWVEGQALLEPWVARVKKEQEGLARKRGKAGMEG